MKTAQSWITTIRLRTNQDKTKSNYLSNATVASINVHA